MLLNPIGSARIFTKKRLHQFVSTMKKGLTGHPQDKGAVRSLRSASTGISGTVGSDISDGGLKRRGVHRQTGVVVSYTKLRHLQDQAGISNDDTGDSSKLVNKLACISCSDSNGRPGCAVCQTEEVSAGRPEQALQKGVSIPKDVDGRQGDMCKQTNISIINNDGKHQHAKSSTETSNNDTDGDPGHVLKQADIYDIDRIERRGHVLQQVFSSRNTRQEVLHSENNGNQEYICQRVEDDTDATDSRLVHKPAAIHKTASNSLKPKDSSTTYTNMKYVMSTSMYAGKH